MDVPILHHYVHDLGSEGLHGASLLHVEVKQVEETPLDVDGPNGFSICDTQLGRQTILPAGKIKDFIQVKL